MDYQLNAKTTGVGLDFVFLFYAVFISVYSGLDQELLQSCL